MRDWLVYLLVAPYPITLAWAMFSDLRRFEIPNTIPIVLALSYLPAGLFLGADYLTMLRQYGIGAAALGVGFVLFGLRVVGGGDVKLIAALLVWLAPLQIPLFLFWTALVGGLVGLLVVALRRLPALTGLFSERLQTKIRSADKIPYGVAIGCAGLITLPNIPLLSN